jgi:hypothetical protein
MHGHDPARAGLDLVRSDELRELADELDAAGLKASRPASPEWPLIISFSRSISAGQSRLGVPTLMQWKCAWPISWSAWAAATRTFFGVQPRFGQVPPRSRVSTMTTLSPAARVGTVTPKAPLPPPMIRTSHASLFILPAPLGTPAARRGVSTFSIVGAAGE